MVATHAASDTAHMPTHARLLVLRLLLLCTAALCSACASTHSAPVLVLDGCVPAEAPTVVPFDVVTLLDAQHTTAGRPEFEQVHGNYAYRFDNEQALARFRAEPARYALAFGGGCAAMGPLSGAGAPTRHFVHDKRVYLAASDGCQTSFLQAPQAHLEPLPETVVGDEAGAALALQCARWLGGDRTPSHDFALRSTKEETEGSRPWVVRKLRVLTHDQVWVDYVAWNADAWWSRGRWTKDGAEGCARSNKTPERGYDAEQLAALRRNLLWEPLAMAREVCAGRVAAKSLGQAQWTIAGRSATGHAVELCCDGVRLVWLIDPIEGALVGQRGVRRRRDARVAETTEFLDEWTSAEGLRAPLVRVRADGVERWDEAQLVTFEER